MAIVYGMQEPPAFVEEEMAVTKVTFWTRLRRHKLAIAGFVVLIGMILAAVFANQLAPFDPNAIDASIWPTSALRVDGVLNLGGVAVTDLKAAADAYSQPVRQEVTL